VYGLQAKRGTTLNVVIRQKLALVAFSVFLFDFLSKSLAVAKLTDQPVNILGSFLKLELVYNLAECICDNCCGRYFLLCHQD
jgi:hypothetical protein